jgi:hypothetical protein
MTRPIPSSRVGTEPGPSRRERVYFGAWAFACGLVLLGIPALSPQTIRRFFWAFDRCRTFRSAFASC